MTTTTTPLYRVYTYTAAGIAGIDRAAKPLAQARAEADSSNAIYAARRYGFRAIVLPA